jgi:hypothetical protein
METDQEVFLSQRGSTTLFKEFIHQQFLEGPNHNNLDDSEVEGENLTRQSDRGTPSLVE